MAEQDFINWYLATFDYTHPNPVGRGAGTPYYRYWEIAVAVPVPNARLNRPKKVRKAIASFTANSGGEGIITITEGSAVLATILKNELAGLGFGRLHKADETDNETFEIKSVTSSTITVTIKTQAPFTKTFVAGAICTITSTTMANEWTVTDSLVTPTSLIKGFPINYNDIDGSINGQQLSIVLSDIDESNKYIETTLSPDIYRFIKSGYKYRIGARYYIGWRSNNSDGSTLSQAAYNNAIFDISLNSNVYTSEEMINLSYWFDNSAIDSSSLKHKYYVFNSVISNTIVDSTSLRDGLRKLRIGIKGTGTIPFINNHIIIGFENIYWEHSGGVESSLGCVLLPNAPTRESVNIGWIEEEFNIDRMANNDGVLSFTKGNPNVNRKYRISCTFIDVPMSALNKLKIIEMFQNDGYLINLHTHFNELPQVLTGYLKISNIKKTGVLFALTTFDFVFEEV